MSTLPKVPKVPGNSGLHDAQNLWDMKVRSRSIFRRAQLLQFLDTA